MRPHSGNRATVSSETPITVRLRYTCSSNGKTRGKTDCRSQILPSSSRGPPPAQRGGLPGRPLSVGAGGGGGGWRVALLPAVPSGGQAEVLERRGARGAAAGSRSRRRLLLTTACRQHITQSAVIRTRPAISTQHTQSTISHQHTAYTQHSQPSDLHHSTVWCHQFNTMHSQQSVRHHSIVSPPDGVCLLPHLAVSRLAQHITYTKAAGIGNRRWLTGGNMA